MAHHVSVPVYQTIYRLAGSYTAYRIIVALSLVLIFLITLEKQTLHYQSPDLYFYSMLSYTILSVSQMILIRMYPHAISHQIIAVFVVDVVGFSMLTYALGGPNLSIGLLFVITVFAANFLLTRNKALLITLAAVIAVVYQQFVGNFLDNSNLNDLGNSVFLAFLFFVVYAIGQVAIQRFQILESLNTHQSIELFKLQNINRYILEQIEVGYLVLDEQYKIIVSNPAACSLLGISPLYAHEQYHLANFQPDLFASLKDTALQDGERFQFQSQQTSYHVDIRVQKLIVPQQALTLLVLEDAQKINQKVQQLKLASLGQLSASIAHEIRNPLAAIAQANELNQDSDTEQKLLLNQMIAKQITRIDKIIKDTLDLAKNKKTQATQIHLPTFIDDLMHHDLQDVRSSIKLSMLSKHPIHFDESQLRQVLVNLIRNALRHNAQQAEYIELKLHETRSHLLIDVIDFGSGIAEQDLAQLFQPFFSTEINGTGLGLYLSHSICEANQAKLVYVEQKQQGACFRIECPLMD